MQAISLAEFVQADNSGISLPPFHLPHLHWDPYLLWALATGFQWSVKLSDSATVPVLLELSKPFDSLIEIQQACPPAEGMSVPEPYFDTYRSRFVTAEVRLAAIGAIMQHASGTVRRMQLGIARTRTQHGLIDLQPIGATDDHRTLVVGVIDDRFAYAHAAFRDVASTQPNQSRIHAIWSQGEKRAPPPNGFLYGSLRWDTSLHPGGSRPLADDDWYRTVGDDRQWTAAPHGTHVLDLAAGSPRPALLDLPASSATDPASTAKLLLVELPLPTVRDVSGGSLGLHLLDGLRFLLAYTKEPETNLVVNISYGTYAGPHDGTSMIEEAMDDLLGLRDNFAIVLPSGNANRENRSIHAYCDSLASGKTAELQLQVIPDDLSETFVELWFPPEDTHSQPLQVEVELVSSTGESTGPARLGDSRFLTESGPGSAVVATVAFLHQVVQGTKGRMALFAIVPTARSAPGPAAPPGVWTIRVRNAGPSAVENIHAWVERHDSLPDAPTRGLQPYFVPESSTLFSLTGKRFTLNALAHGNHPLCAGGLVHRQPPGKNLDPAYAGIGPGRDGAPRAPNVQAISDAGIGLKGVRAAGARTGSTARISGTSMSAAWLSRYVAVVLQNDAPTLADSRTIGQIKAMFNPRRPERADEQIDETLLKKPFP